MIIIITSLVCLAVHILLTWDEMILKPLGDRMAELLPEWLIKPLFSCLSCMGMWYSLGAWILSMNPEITDHPLLYNLTHIPNMELGIIPSMLCTMGLNGILMMMITAVRTAQHRLELEELKQEDSKSEGNK